MSHQIIYHLVPKPIWLTCKETAKSYLPTTYEQDGFIHATKDASTLVDIGNYFCKQDKADYLVLCIDPDLLEVPLKYESAAPVGNKEAHTSDTEMLFPHIYGPLNLSSVIKEYDVTRDDDGSFISIKGLAD